MQNKIKDMLDSIPDDGLIYLVEKITDKAGFFVSRKHLLYIVVNADHEMSQSISTEYILLNTNIDIHAFAVDSQFQTGKYNVLDYIPTSDGYNESDLDSFVQLCSAHAIYMNSSDFVKFFYSLINLFQYPVEQEYKNLIGLFGELSVIKYVFEKTGRDISESWHNTGSSGKYDFVLKKMNFEVKSSTSSEKEAEIKHSQLFNADPNYLVFVSIEPNNSGISTNQLINQLLQSEKYCKNYSFTMNIEKEKKRISPVDADRLLFSVKEISFFKASVINPLKQIPSQISSLTYKLDLSDACESDIISVMEANNV